MPRVPERTQLRQGGAMKGLERPAALVLLERLQELRA
jgi:hypothetical protein